MKYDANTKRKVHAALEAALDRMRLLRRKPSYWEADCLSKAVTAISQGKYGLAQSKIDCSLLPPLDGWRPPANASDASLVELRASLAVLGSSGPTS
ncbi:MAG TPA: hypothetical protein VK681_34030 [Reyranella sp.]|nr:hypothetical protein [Reyranella sp.]